MAELVSRLSAARVGPWLRPVSYRWFARPLDKILGSWARLRGRRYDNYRLESIDGARFIVLPSVFNPKLPRTGAFLISCVDGKLLEERSEVLDLGTGSGVGAVFAARYARRVVAVDINPAAVRCARINAQLNAVEDRIDVRLGDLFAPVAGERFDVVLFNPPFLRGSPRDDRDRAWRSTDVPERFAAGLAAHLKPGGVALMVLSTFGDAGAFLDQCAQQGLLITRVKERSYLNERLAIFRLEAVRAGTS